MRVGMIHRIGQEPTQSCISCLLNMKPRFSGARTARFCCVNTQHLKTAFLKDLRISTYAECLVCWIYEDFNHCREGILQPHGTPHAPPTPSPPLREVGSSVGCQVRAHTGSVAAQCCRHMLRSSVWTTLSVSSGKWRQSWCSRSRSSNLPKGCKDRVEFEIWVFWICLCCFGAFTLPLLCSSCYS